MRRGVAPWASLDIAVWAVPFGIIGARIYHLITSPQDYFGAGGDPIRALLHLGGRPRHLGCGGRRRGRRLARRPAARPAVQRARRLARPRRCRWRRRSAGSATGSTTSCTAASPRCRGACGCTTWTPPTRATRRCIDGKPVTKPDLYHPTFLYEAIWDLGVALLVWLLDRRFKFGRGRAFALYVMAYTVGRFWIEMLRTDEANHFFGIRLNVFTAALVFLRRLIYFLVVRGPRAYVVPEDAPEVRAGAGGRRRRVLGRRDRRRGRPGARTHGVPGGQRGAVRGVPADRDPAAGLAGGRGAGDRGRWPSAGSAGPGRSSRRGRGCGGHGRRRRSRTPGCGGRSGAERSAQEAAAQNAAAQEAGAEVDAGSAHTADER